MSRFEHPVIAMIHLQALPGTPFNKYSLDKIEALALEEARTYARFGIQNFLIENMHDIPYLKGAVGPEIISSITRIASSIRRAFPHHTIGLQVLANANKEALAIAQASSLQFIRVESYVFGHQADEGLMESNAGNLLRFRKVIGADDIRIYCDIQKKHASHSITSDLNLQDWAKAAQFFAADGVIITGKSTGSSPSLESVKKLHSKLDSDCSLLIGSGVTADNVADYCQFAEACIIGSYFKKKGYWKNPLSTKRIQRLLDKLHTY